jgi:hypothetical protein
LVPVLILLLSGMQVIHGAAPADKHRPVRGKISYSVFLCKYKNEGTPPKTTQYYEDLFFGVGKGGLADYWDSMSRGTVQTDGVVVGWYTVASTTAEAKLKSRSERFNECVNRIKQATGYSAPSDHVTVVVTYPGVDLWGGGGQVFAAWNSPLGSFQHEALHSIGLAHSFTNDTSYCNVDWAFKAEYGDL